MGDDQLKFGCRDEAKNMLVTEEDMQVANANNNNIIQPIQDEEGARVKSKKKPWYFRRGTVAYLMTKHQPHENYQGRIYLKRGR